MGRGLELNTMHPEGRRAIGILIICVVVLVVGGVTKLMGGG